MPLLNTVRFFLQHPLSRERPLAALERFVRWQFTSRLGFGPSVVPFVEDAHLIVSRGMSGATANIYVGLHEYDDMAFLLHVLRPQDLFVDIGANIGSYTILAAKGVGARTIAVEPLPATYAHLENNIHYNRVGHLVDARNVGLAGKRGNLLFSADLDTTNHIVNETYAGPKVNVDVLPLDELLADCEPFAIKIDVEGFEREVLAGGARALSRSTLQVVVIEVGEQLHREGQPEKPVVEMLREAGFTSYTYDPRNRQVIATTEPSVVGNYIFVRDVAIVRERVSTARTYRVGPWSI